MFALTDERHDEKVLCDSPKLSWNVINVYATYLLTIATAMSRPMLQGPPVRPEARRLPQGHCDDARDGVHAHR